jgi:hypothetical protein
VWSIREVIRTRRQALVAPRRRGDDRPFHVLAGRPVLVEPPVDVLHGDHPDGAAGDVGDETVPGADPLDHVVQRFRVLDDRRIVEPGHRVGDRGRRGVVEGLVQGDGPDDPPAFLHGEELIGERPQVPLGRVEQTAVSRDDRADRLHRVAGHASLQPLA